MKKTLRKVLPLLLAVAMLAAMLSGCGDDSKIKDDPAGYLQEALTKTQDELLARYASSPSAAVAESMSAASTSLAFDLSLDGGSAMESVGSAGLNGTVYADAENSKYLFDGAISTMGVEIGAQLYYEPEFLGVSCPLLFGDETLYGVRPYGIMEQAEGSIFDEASGSQFGSDISGLQDIDDVLDALRNAEGASIKETMDSITTTAQSFNTSIEFSVEDAKVTVGGKETDGYKLSGTYTSEDMATYMDQIMTILQDNAAFSGLLDLARQYDSGTEVESFDEQLSAALDEIRSSGAEMQVSYYIADGKVISMEFTSTDSADEAMTTTAVVNYYDGENNAITMSIAGTDENGADVTATISSTVDTSNGYSHILSIECDTDGERGAVMCTTDWASDSGDIKVDMTVYAGETDTAAISLSGNLTAAKGEGFSLTGGVISILDGSAGSELLTGTLSLEGANDAEVPTPTATTNIFEMTEEDFTNTVLNIYSVLYGAM